MLYADNVSLPGSVCTCSEACSLPPSYHAVTRRLSFETGPLSARPCRDEVGSLPDDVCMTGVDASIWSAMSNIDVELPAPVEMCPAEDNVAEGSDSDDDIVNGFDLAVDFVGDEDDVDLGFLSSDDESAGVPTAEIARHLTLSQDIAEFFSVPRVVPKAVSKYGLRGSLSLDVLNGWDFYKVDIRGAALALLHQLQIWFLILSPPCTAFSHLQVIYNFKKMTKERVQDMMAKAMVLLEFAVRCAMAMHEAGKFFVFEHPSRATSWKTDVLMRLAELPGVYTCHFDQCMLGLVSKVYKVPMRKRTKLLTNSVHVYRAFHQKFCDKSHPHQTIHGSEGGVDRARWAQCYPDAMVDLLAQCAHNHTTA
jgi:hypothetical protein